MARRTTDDDDRKQLNQDAKRLEAEGDVRGAERLRGLADVRIPANGRTNR